MVARRVVVHGDVQGVYFRAATRESAREADVAGWVRNRADGAVEAWLEGEPAAVERVLDWMRAGGPPTASVDRVETEEVTPEGHEVFRISG